jgi:hypothetical protein
MQPQNHDGDQAQPRGWHDEPMVVRTLAVLVLRQVLGMVGRTQFLDVKDVEIAVLRHQLAVLHR